MKGRRKWEIPEKTADQWHRPARFPHAKIRETEQTTTSCQSSWFGCAMEPALLLQPRSSWQQTNPTSGKRLPYQASEITVSTNITFPDCLARASRNHRQRELSGVHFVKTNYTATYNRVFASLQVGVQSNWPAAEIRRREALARSTARRAVELEHATREVTLTEGRRSSERRECVTWQTTNAAILAEASTGRRQTFRCKPTTDSCEAPVSWNNRQLET
ncbi:hypothetical protein PR048_018309 [Dryococelus australis]|uniref:Uncharacterized protein n=1 Tax=Dryococelus australis TaxID=614101 RepID=A0ABQ9HC01_9NEOP|nr:hypothetical protein PR048_018309 [Dryococelus australis]